jgi:hypothetical protein
VNTPSTASWGRPSVVIQIFPIILCPNKSRNYVRQISCSPEGGPSPTPAIHYFLQM